MVITVKGLIDGVLFHVDQHPDVVVKLDFPYLYKQLVFANMVKNTDGTYHIIKTIGLEEGVDLTVRQVADQIARL